MVTGETTAKKVVSRYQEINWRSACKNLLDRQKQQITSSPLHRKVRDLDSVHVPLGLVEHKERPKIDKTQEISPERGSDVYQQGYTETKRVEHDAFLMAISQRQPGEHVVILGEPGAGKTTLLTKVWEWLLEQPGEDIIVAWVSLVAVKSNELEEYLRKSWLKDFCKSGDIDRYWASFEALADAGRVWLLLDGADEMGGEALGKIETTLGEVWARSTRAIATCRLNLWDAGSTNKLQTSSNFQVYRTLDFKYVNPAGRDEVKGFIDNWFRSGSVSEGASTTAAGQKLRGALDEVGKERIKDLAQNPLRLTLLCAFWEEGQALPETQAGLYELFVDYVYDWKATEFLEAVKLRGELDRALGVLAKQSINKPSLRFRFTEAELRKWVPVVEQRQALMALGWLNCVGEENQRPVFAFFHPTFQEYFAACSIDDWDYFLPRAHVDRPVPCLGEEGIGATYRVFESEWRQPIVLWFGRGDVADEDKEEFIEKLTTFQDGAGEFYYYRAYCLGAIGVGEFKSSQKAQKISEQVLVWAFGYFDNEEERWVTFFDKVKSLARKAIPFTFREYVIDALIRLLAREDLDHNLCSSVADALSKIGVGNECVINALIPLLARKDLDHDLCSSVADALSKIGVGNEYAINALIPLLAREDLDRDLSNVADALSKIGVGNECAINALIPLLAREDLDHDLCNVADVLSKIGVGDECAINALIPLLARKDLDDKHHSNVADVLSKIGVGNECAINALIPLLTRKDLDDKHHSNVADVLSKIGVGNECAINALVLLLTREDLDDKHRSNVADALGQIGLGDECAINALIQLLAREDLEHNLCSSVADALSKIGVGNECAINALIQLLAREDLNYLRRYFVALTLGEIGLGRKRASSALSPILAREDFDDYLCFGVALALNQIGVGKEHASDALIQLVQLSTKKDFDDYLHIGSEAPIPILAREDFDDYLRFRTVLALGQIGLGNERTINAPIQLVQLLRREDLDDKHLRGNESVINALILLLTRENLGSDRFRKVATALGQIGVGNERAISTLVLLLTREDLGSYRRLSVVNALGQIGLGNEYAINALISLSRREDLNSYHRYSVANALSQIGLGNEYVIGALVQFLAPEDLHDFRHDYVAEILSQIGLGNEYAIGTLIQFLAREDLHYLRRYYVAEALGQIGLGNEYAINALTSLLRREDLNSYHRYSVVNALCWIVTKPMMPSVLETLKDYSTAEICQSNPGQYEFCSIPISFCAQTLAYPEFHAAWHPSFPTQTNSNYPDLTNRCHTIHLNIEDINNYTTSNDITTELSLRIH